MATTDDNERRIEKLEERLNLDERELTALGTEVQLAKDDLSRRIDRTNEDLRERITDIKTSIANDHVDINKSINNIEDEVKNLSHSLQKLYITQEGSGTKIQFNEKIIWAIIGIAGAIALTYIQEWLRVGGLG